MPAEILIVIPTLGERVDFLKQTLQSIRTQGVPVDIVVVAPADKQAITELTVQFGCELLPDPGSQTAAINLGVQSATAPHRFVNWLGDDDRLTPGSLALTAGALDSNPEAVVAYGACEYIDSAGKLLWVSRAGQWAPRLLSWGPDLIPQPGMLIRRTSWDQVKGVDTSLRFAFDLDLLLKLRGHGTFVDVGDVVSQFRWHADSLTVSDRSTSLDESEVVKRRHLSGRARKVAWLWEKPIRAATRIAAWQVSRKAAKLRSN